VFALIDMGYKGAAYATICAKVFGFYFNKALLFVIQNRDYMLFWMYVFLLSKKN
jgi:Na+-driven multidrug efflux pump